MHVARIFQEVNANHYGHGVHFKIDINQNDHN